MEALIPGILVGIFTLLGVFLQNRHQAGENTKRLAHERLLAKETFEREKVAAENEELANQVREQLSWGNRIAISVGRARLAFEDASTAEERGTALRRVAELAGFNLDGYYPLADLLGPDLLEDQQLRDLVRQHRDLIDKHFLDLLLHSQHHPEVLPDQASAVIDTVRPLARSIEMRMRELKRDGLPL